MTAAPRHCIKCGREIGPDESICEVCNRAGMKTPSASQYHGTMVVAIVVGVILMAVAASLAMRGVGPFSADVTRTTVGADGITSVTLSVRNDGTAAGRAKCRIVAQDGQGRSLLSRSVVSPRIGPGRTSTFSEPMVGLAERPASVSADCG